MSRLVSSRSVEDCLQGPVFGEVVRDTVLPAAPDDAPGAGEDADGVGVVVAAGAGSGVEVGGPGVGVVGVAGEVDDGAAQLFVHGPAEAGHHCLAGLAGRWSRAGKGGLGTFAPRLDAAGNSVKGQLAAAFLSRRLGLDLFVSGPG